MPQGTSVDLTTDLSLSGAVAQYARSSALIKDMADHLIGEFAANLAAKLSAEQTTDRAEGAPSINGDGQPDLLPALANGELPSSPAAQPISGIALFLLSLKKGIVRFFGRS